jgi:hypothetical protein
METPINTTGIGMLMVHPDSISLRQQDLNDRANLTFYTRLVQFQMDSSQHETMFKNPNSSEQRTLHSLAHEMGLEYEHSLETRTVRITRAIRQEEEASIERQVSGIMDLNLPVPLEGGVFDFINFDPPEAPGELLDDSFCLSNAMNVDSTLANHEKYGTYLSEICISSTDFPALNSDYDSEIYPLSTSFDITGGFSVSTSMQTYQPPPPQQQPLPNAGRRNLFRASQACESCRSRKLSCHGQKPTPCNNCIEKSILCNYPDPRLKQYAVSMIQLRNANWSRKKRGWLKGSGSNQTSATESGTVGGQESNSFRVQASLMCENDAPGQPTINPDVNMEGVVYEPNSTINQNIRNSPPITLELTRYHHEIYSNQTLQTLGEINDLQKSLQRQPSFDTINFSPQRAASSLGSAGSVQSVRGRNPIRNMFSRRPSMHSPASSEYQEIVFDSYSAHSPGHTSVSSGRRGPMDGFARAAMKAVKAVGACWKCKFLRKTVSKPESLKNSY